MLLRGASAEHAGESGVQLSVGAEMEAYGKEVVAVSNLQILGGAKQESLRQPTLVELARSDRGHSH